MMLNVLERRFVLLGVVFRPQDFYLVVLIALDGPRPWCCHRRRGAHLVRLAVPADGLHGDGLPPARILDRRLGRAAAAAQSRAVDEREGVRKGVKHAIFFALSFVIANVFLAWIIGAGAL